MVQREGAWRRTGIGDWKTGALAAAAARFALAQAHPHRRKSATNGCPCAAHISPKLTSAPLASWPGSPVCPPVRA